MEKSKADAIITAYLQKIYGFAMKKSFSYDEAEEICSSIVAELYPSLLTANEIYNIDGYVWRICEHVYAKFVASKKKHQGLSIDGIEIPCTDEDLPDEASEEIACLYREIAFLTQLRRDIVYAYYFENKSVSLISREMQIPDGTIKWHLNKARNHLKEGLAMERKIGKLGLHPIKANSIGHGGTPGQCGGPEFYLKDSLSLNIVYSVYHQPKTRDEIAEELGVTPVFIEEKIKILEDNSFLVKQAGSRYTTYVQFTPETFSLEQRETVLKKQLAAAELLAGDYANSVRAAVSDMNDVYIPGGNRQLLEAAAIFYGIMHHCQIPIDRDLSRYQIKTLDGGCYYAFVDIPAVQSDTDYKPTLHLPSYDACGNMYRSSEIYPIYSWSMDTRYSSRLGRWKNNLAADYEYLYEFISGAITDNQANAEKFGRLRERQYITEYGKVNIMMVKGNVDDFSAKIPQLDETLKRQIADNALEMAEITAKAYPPQMRDIVVSFDTSYFISSTVALMVMDILYGNGTFRALTENEKVTSNLIMFSDKLPNE